MFVYNMVGFGVLSSQIAGEEVVMAQDRIAEALSDQFTRAWGMFREAVLAFPADEWRKGEMDYLRPAGVALHVVETADFYAGDQSADEFPWGGRFGVGWEDRRSERLPTQEQLIGYLDEVEKKVEAWLRSTDFLSQEQQFPHTGPIILGRAMYLLRHNQHHLAEMGLELTRRGFQGPGWK
jgi:hypothetical protein